MSKKKPLGITIIGYFYILGAFVLLITLFTDATDQFGIAVRFGVPDAPEKLVKVIVAVFSLVTAYGYLKLQKWGFWIMIIYAICFWGISFNLSQQFNQQPFYGNMIWSVIVLIYTLSKSKYFYRKID